MDRETSQIIEHIQHEKRFSACGCILFKSLLLLAREKNLHIKTIDLKSSSDTAESGDKNRVVGIWCLCH